MHSVPTQNPKMATARKTLIVASALTLVVYIVPFLSVLAYPFSLLSTLAHEMGHGLAAVMVGGDFISFTMWANGSGVANISGNFNPFARAFVAGFGLIGPSLLATIFFLNLTSVARARAVLASFAIVLLIAIALVVRNPFGIFFVSLVAVISLYCSLGAGKAYSQIVLAFLAVQLALSVFSRSDYLFTDQAITSVGLMPSDVAQMADALWLPYWFWGALCGLISLSVLAFGIKRSFRS